VCVVLCTVFRLIVMLFCVMCVIYVLCLIAVPLPPGKNPFAVKINNNNENGLRCQFYKEYKYRNNPSIVLGRLQEQFISARLVIL
jgi:hypothetical protein